MIFVRLFGGLGNQLFQYAAARHLADIHQTSLKLDPTFITANPLRSYALDAFNIRAECGHAEEFSHLPRRKPAFITRKPGQPRWFKEQKPFHYDATLCKLPDNTYLDGYWQSERYFKPIEHAIREDLQLRDQLTSQEAEFAHQITECDSICFHVRRGDYVGSKKARDMHGLCKPDYYEQAEELVAKQCGNPHAFVFSDEPDWARQQVSPSIPTTFLPQRQDHRDHIDLWLMSQCKHNIIANSTFSWWGAWLNTQPDQMVIAPSVWVVKPGMTYPDVLPKHWHTIDGFSGD